MEKVRLTAEQGVKLELLLAANTRFHQLFLVYHIMKDGGLWPEQETALLLKVSEAESMARQRKEELFTIEESGNEESRHECATIHNGQGK